MRLFRVHKYRNIGVFKLVFDLFVSCNFSFSSSSLPVKAFANLTSEISENVYNKEIKEIRLIENSE